jgi:hypothetical protein
VQSIQRILAGVYSWTLLEKNLKVFAPCYSQSPPPADFTGFLGLEISIATAESRGGSWLCLHYLFLTFKSSIFISSITLYLYIKTYNEKRKP